MKMRAFLFSITWFFAFGCGGKTVKVQIKDVCSQPLGTRVEIEGYISLPEFMERRTHKKGDYYTTTYTLSLRSDSIGTGEKIRVLIEGSSEAKANFIEPLPDKYSSADLLIHAANGELAGSGKLLKIIGVTEQNDKGSCDVNVEKIAVP